MLRSARIHREADRCHVTRRGSTARRRFQHYSSRIQFQIRSQSQPLAQGFRASSMFLDKLCWVDPAARVFAIAGADERREEFTHFEMKMREVTAVGRADSRDLLATFHGFSGMD